VWKLLCILREGETGIHRTWCVGSRLEVVGGAYGGEEQEEQQGCYDAVL